VLAQVWRAGPKTARLARLLAGSEVDVLDEARAKQAGVRLGNRGGNDVVDSQVACCAVEREAVVATSDPDDIGALLEPGEAVRTIAV
jgi:hypothetical protein